MKKLLILIVPSILVVGCFPTQMRQTSTKIDNNAITIVDNQWKVDIDEYFTVDAQVNISDDIHVDGSIHLSKINYTGDLGNGIQINNVLSSPILTSQEAIEQFEEGVSLDVWSSPVQFFVSDKSFFQDKEYGIILNEISGETIKAFIVENPIEEINRDIEVKIASDKEKLENQLGLELFESRTVHLHGKNLQRYNELYEDVAVKTDFNPFTDDDEAYITYSRYRKHDIVLTDSIVQQDQYFGSSYIKMLHDKEGSLRYVSVGPLLSDPKNFTLTPPALSLQDIQAKILEDFTDPKSRIYRHIFEMELSNLLKVKNIDDMVFELEPVWVIKMHINSTDKNNQYDPIGYIETIYYSALDGRRL